jgi:hypothetical protein
MTCSNEAQPVEIPSHVPVIAREDRLTRAREPPPRRSGACAGSLPVHLKVFGPVARTGRPGSMSDETERPRFREHLRDMGKALGGIGKDVKIDVAEAPRVAKEGTKNALARAAGIRRSPMREWTEPASEEPK